MNSPKTHLEGMMMKYNSLDYTQDIYMYCDIDIVILKSLHNLIDQMEPNKFYVMAEGSLLTPDYNAAFSKEKQLTFIKQDTGYSAGKFVITSQKIRDIIFNEIRGRCNFDTTFYTIDQPYFNCIMYELRNTPLLNTELFNSSYISFNGQKYNRDITVLFDCAGEPADGKKHIIKYVDFTALSVMNFF